MTTVPTTTLDDSSTEVDRARSRERAVSRVYKGVVVTAVGYAGMLAVPIAEALFGASQSLQEVWSIGARSLVWIGFLVAATAATHLLRYGGRRGTLAFVSFAAAGASGLVAVAEQFEYYFLDTSVLRGLDLWGLAGAVVFFLMGMWLLGSWDDALRRDPAEEDEG